MDQHEQEAQRRRFEEEAMEWARLRLVNEARGRGQSSTQINLVMGMVAGGGAAFDVTTTSTTTSTSTTSTTTAGPTTTTTTATPTTTTTTTEDPNWFQLGFVDWTWVETNIGSRSSVAAWNSALISTAGVQFTSVAVDEEGFTVKLYGGVNVALDASALASSNVTSIIDSSSGAIQSIGNSFASGCTDLQSASLDSAVTMGNSVFQGCTFITSLSFNSLTTVGTSCFEGCTAMTSFQASSLSTIGDKAFKDCTALTTISIGDSSGGLGSGSNLYSGTDGVFSGIIGNTISLVFSAIPFTATGAFEEDLLYILENNTVTLNSTDPAWVTVDAGSFDINAKEYTANGTAHGTGSPAIGLLGFVINTTGSPTTDDTVFNSGSTSLGAFSAATTSVTWSTTYYVRSYIAGSFGTVYSLDEETFTTPADPTP